MRAAVTRVYCPECSTERIVKGAGRSRVHTCRPCAMTLRYSPRFWPQVDRTASCWLWKGRLSRDGYGALKINGRTVRVHRYAYVTLIGPIPAGHVVDHTCRVRHCVNPAHLEAVTPKENWKRGTSFSVANAAKTHCPRGHAYTPDNTYRMPRGARVCRTCKREAGRDWMRARRQRRDPELLAKARAREAVRVALDNGSLTRLACEVCGNETVQAHHLDYAEPLHVQWLCIPHHAAAHSAARRDVDNTHIFDRSR